MTTFPDVTSRLDREIVRLADAIRAELAAELDAARRERLMAASARLGALRADMEAVRAAIREEADRPRALDPEHIAMALSP